MTITHVSAARTPAVPASVPPVAAVLQQTLVDTVELAAQAKQAHWNAHGTAFLPVHAWLDQLAGLLRGHADTIAERLAALGVAPDARTATVAAGTTLAPFPAGPVATGRAMDALGTALHRLGTDVRSALTGSADLAGDPASADVLTALLRDLDKQLWTARAQS